MSHAMHILLLLVDAMLQNIDILCDVEYPAYLEAVRRMVRHLNPR